MATDINPKELFYGNKGASMALRFSGKLDLYRRMHRLTIFQLAEKIGVKSDRMEYLLTGAHEPKAGDIVRIERSLGIFFDPEDFEQEGMP